MSGEPNTTILIGDGPGSSILDRVPLCMATRTGREVCFAAVLEPVSKATQPTVSSVRCQEEDGGQRIEVNRAGETDVVTLADDGRVNVQAAGRSVLNARP